jgi:hypothetical protein
MHVSITCFKSIFHVMLINAWLCLCTWFTNANASLTLMCYSCSHNLPTQQYAILALIWTLRGISSSLPSYWTYIHFSFHNRQVYAINSISCSTLSKRVRPLMVLSFNSPKLTKGLDVLIALPAPLAPRAFLVQLAPHARAPVSLLTLCGGKTPGTHRTRHRPYH